METDASRCDLVLSEWRAVGFFGTLLVWRAEADHGPASNQRRLVAFMGFRKGCLDLRGIMAVDAAGGPACRFEALQLIHGRRKIGRPIDGDRVIVEEHDQLFQLEMPCKVDSFVADPLHKATVACNHISKMIAGRIAEARIHEALRDGHADGIR